MCVCVLLLLIFFCKCVIPFLFFPVCFQVLLEQVVTKTEGYEVYKLEKLYALLCQSIYRHRRDYNKTALIQVITGRALVNFAPVDILSWCN